MSYAPLDIVLAVVIFILVVRAALRGFVEEVMAVAWLALGLLCAILFFARGAVFIRSKVETLQDIRILPEVLAFVILFLIVFIVVKIFTLILRDIINRIRLGGLDHFLGAVFGLVEGITVAALVILVITIQPLFDKAAVLDKSMLAGFLTPKIETVQTIIKNEG
jgi:membrane protein required for colicin V production